VNLIDELRVAHAIEEKSVVPPRRVVSSSILRGDSETECLLEEVVNEGLDDDDPFFLMQRLVIFFRDCSILLTNKYIQGFQPVTRYTNIILEYGL
jgi:hypothetical protein